MQCHQCERTMAEARLQKCRICHKMFCDDHKYDWRGNAFCSKACSDYFYFAETGDDEEDE